jgi:hypothetical protein
MNGKDLTIKWMLPDGSISYFATDALSAVADIQDPQVPSGCQPWIKRVEFDNGTGDGVRSIIDRGTVYIMNAAGKTIDRIVVGGRVPRADAA